MKNSKGFTLVELVVVIAILGILAGIAIPRFLEATKTARGAKIVADMRTLESAVYVYYAKHAEYPTNSASLTEMMQGGWPTPPIGDVAIAYKTSAGASGVNEFEVKGGEVYQFTDNSNDANKKGFITLSTSAVSGKYVVDLITDKI